MATNTETATWGVTGSAGVTGIVTDIDVNEEAQTAPEYNEVGAVVKQTHYDTHTTVTATIEVATTTALPTAGSQITIGGRTGYVRSARKVESNQAYQKISVTVERWQNCSAASTPSSGSSGGNGAGTLDGGGSGT